MKTVRAAIIGSGSGSTGMAIIESFFKGLIPSLTQINAFISTVPGAGLLLKAKEQGIRSLVFDDSDRRNFYCEVHEFVNEFGINLLISAGCRALLPNDLGISVVNTHPEDKEKHGGHYMVGLAPHLHFLEYEIMDLLWRGRASVETPFYAQITFHYCGGNPSIMTVTPYDCGATIMQVPVLIPKEIIEQAWEIRRPCRLKSGEWDWFKEKARLKAMDRLAQMIQNHVLVHERTLVPQFVERAAWLVANS